MAHNRINNSGKNSKRAGPMKSEQKRAAIRIKLSVISDISQVVHQTTPILHERLAFYPACACPSPPPRPTNPPSFGERLPTTKRHGGLWWVINGYQFMSARLRILHLNYGSHTTRQQPGPPGYFVGVSSSLQRSASQLCQPEVPGVSFQDTSDPMETPTYEVQADGKLLLTLEQRDYTLPKTNKAPKSMSYKETNLPTTFEYFLYCVLAVNPYKHGTCPNQMQNFKNESAFPRVFNFWSRDLFSSILRQAFGLLTNDLINLNQLPFAAAPCMPHTQKKSQVFLERRDAACNHSTHSTKAFPCKTLQTLGAKPCCYSHLTWRSPHCGG